MVANTRSHYMKDAIDISSLYGVLWQLTVGDADDSERIQDHDNHAN